MLKDINEYACNQLEVWLPQAFAITKNRLNRRFFGAEAVWAQLEFIDNFVKEGRKPTEAEVERVILFNFINRELDGNDDSWAEPLQNVAYHFGNLGHPELEVFHEGPWKRLQVNLPKAFEMTKACLKLHPGHPQFRGIMEELEKIEGIHRARRKPTHDERMIPIPCIAGTSSDAPACSMKTYVAMIDAIDIDWEALCNAPDPCLDPDQGGRLYPDLSGL